MDCIRQPGTDLEFHADFKSGFSFSVRLIPIFVDYSKVLRLFFKYFDQKKPLWSFAKPALWFILSSWDSTSLTLLLRKVIQWRHWKKTWTFLKQPKTFDVPVEMEINWTKKIKAELKLAWNSEATHGCPMQPIQREHYLESVCWERNVVFCARPILITGALKTIHTSNTK